jgi:hypothetical protein
MPLHIFVNLPEYKQKRQNVIYGKTGNKAKRCSEQYAIVSHVLKKKSSGQVKHQNIDAKREAPHKDIAQKLVNKLLVTGYDAVYPHDCLSRKIWLKILYDSCVYVYNKNPIGTQSIFSKYNTKDKSAVLYNIVTVSELPNFAGIEKFVD